MSAIIATASSILSKSTPPDNQSVIQGIRTAAERLTAILSALFSGQIYKLTNNYRECFIFPVVCFSLALGGVSLSWNFLYPGKTAKI